MYSLALLLLPALQMFNVGRGVLYSLAMHVAPEGVAVWPVQGRLHGDGRGATHRVTDEVSILDSAKSG